MPLHPPRSLYRFLVQAHNSATLHLSVLKDRWPIFHSCQQRRTLELNSLGEESLPSCWHSVSSQDGTNWLVVRETTWFICCFEERDRKTEIMTLRKKCLFLHVDSLNVVILLIYCILHTCFLQCLAQCLYVSKRKMNAAKYETSLKKSSSRVHETWDWVNS